ncbi:TRAFAC clade GTPase domain-containing protein [Raoultella terrigena]|uniref:TRAFAC clade GTPase domain-containing protein n=1 Tax=Raoultella terrigena TaxID=577 RepID=UPI001430CBBF|nr:hypothetical protein [Raoultella terrigena]QIT30728.1 hypothetical protein HCK03_23465 [Raoultella terrigena]
MITMQHTIIGMPGSGKTTYLAALWHLLTSNEVNSKFILNRLVGNRVYLDKIADLWQKCEEVPRTSLAAETKVSIDVKESHTGKNALLNFPEFSGESFELQIASRKCKKDYVEGLNGDGGILLFVTADKITDGLSIRDVAPVNQSQNITEVTDEHTEWDHKMVPSQVSLVELLQFLQNKPFKIVNRKLSIIISAWDVVEAQSLSPLKWLEREYPLLFQFLMNNRDYFNFRIFGISAQGGDVTSDSRNELALKVPSKRITCIGEDTEPHDLTSPIAWLMSKE